MAEHYDAKLAQLLRDLGSPDWKIATRAQQSLVRVGEAALSPLCELLNADPAIAWRAAWVLGRLKDARAVPFLAQRLLQLQQEESHKASHHEDRKVLLLVEIAEALGVLGDAAGTAALCAGLGSKNQSVHMHAKAALTRIGRGVVPHLYACLDQLPPKGLATAVIILGKQGDARAIQPLCAMLEHEDGLVRLRATEALGALALKYPVLELRFAIPHLERSQRSWSWSAAPHRAASRRTLQRIESATGHLQSVPLPSSSAPADPDTLPLPAALIEEHPHVRHDQQVSWLARLRIWLRGESG